VAKATRIYKQYGKRAVEIVRENPYRLATDIWGIGFQSADELAQKLGIERNSPLRARAALNYVLKTLGDEGHCAFPEMGVIEKTTALIAVDSAIVEAAVQHQCRYGELIREQLRGVDDPRFDGPWLYLKSLHIAEQGVARAIRNLGQGNHPLEKINVEAALNWVEGKIGLQLAPSQRDAIRQALTCKLLIITGGPGVGKTTIVRGILEIFAAKNLECKLCAPTGRAAKRLSETTGRNAKTIHRLLEFDHTVGGFNRNADKRLEMDLLIVDESSMVDILLMNQLLRAVPASALAADGQPVDCAVCFLRHARRPAFGLAAVFGIPGLRFFPSLSAESRHQRSRCDRGDDRSGYPQPVAGLSDL
jgi:exodeoxyribonuclease V alpha subunit